MTTAKKKSSSKLRATTEASRDKLSSKEYKQYEKRAKKIFSVLKSIHPQADIELNFDNNFQLLVAVVLSAQSTDISVNKVTDTLFLKVKTPVDILNLSQEDLENHLRSIGLWKAKARHVRQLSQQLQDLFDGQVPCTLHELESLAGVGRKTASVVLSIAFDTPIIAVDTHVFRVSKRLGLALENLNVDQVANYLNEYTPKEYLAHAHHLLIFHGRYLCKARKPLCSQCTLSKYCTYFHENVSDIKL